MPRMLPTQMPMDRYKNASFFVIFLELVANFVRVIVCVFSHIYCVCHNYYTNPNNFFRVPLLYRLNRFVNKKREKKLIN